tara:strand:- start:29571 stop:30425 length:855 start_codon:yes stop_codon:yes gene_type:complete
MKKGITQNSSIHDFNITWEKKRSEFVLAHPQIFPRKNYYYFNSNCFSEFYRLLSPIQRQEFNATYFQYFNEEEQNIIFQIRGGKDHLALFEKFQSLEHGQYEALKENFSFCFLNDIFFVGTFLTWRNYAHPNDKDRWMPYFPIDIQIQTFHANPSIMISGLFDYYIKLDSTQEQEQFFKKVFAFCFNGDEFNQQTFDRFTARIAHPVEKFRWRDLCPKMMKKEVEQTVIPPPPGFKGFIPRFEALSIGGMPNPWTNCLVQDSGNPDEEKQKPAARKYNNGQQGW